MTTTKKLVIAVVALSLALVAFAGTTLAWLTSTPDPVTNTFTAGDVAIILNEAPTNEYGEIVDGDRRTANTYKLVPGREYEKDPTVFVQANSEECYVFVKIDNQLVGVIDESTDIDTQILANGWSALEGYANIYYKLVPSASTETELVVFDGFKVDEEADNDVIKNNDGNTIIVTAYAVQEYGFANAKAAWDGNFKN